MPVGENNVWVIKTTNEFASFKCWKFFNRVNIYMENYICRYQHTHEGMHAHTCSVRRCWEVDGSKFGK